MEFKEALQLLRDRLDENLIYHTKLMDRSDIGQIYRLQALAGTHFYMKAVHDYTPAEVEALLQYVDPLEVAYWCREENTHEVGLPICDILKEIQANERFSKIEPELPLVAKTAKLIDRLKINLITFFHVLQQLDDHEIARRGERISATWAAYSYVADELMRDNLDEGMIDHLLSFEDPLQYLTDRWPECTLLGENVLADLQKEITAKDDLRDKPESVHDRLKDTSKKVQEQPKANKSLRGDVLR